MAYKIGAQVGMEGEASFKKSLDAITQKSKVLKAEMYSVSSGFREAGDWSSIYERKTNTLTKQIANQKEMIKLLSAQLQKSTEETGENSKETQELERQLYRAQGELGKMETKLDKVAKESDKSEERFRKLGETLKVVGTAMATVAVAAGAAAIKLGKEVVNAYADFEQLVGGVETLFKESAPLVEEYATNAYKTAGMSANEYMETVTSFSASLIQSLGGDTTKAAEYANVAITDMSDNANKMGTDISSLQNAYSGFAKQNYTMLDNLKLGYGGTKEEMERLIRDAEKLDSTFSVTHTTAKNGADEITYSYADIVKAIHIVQNEMGITGTTAAEAEHTIAGSIATLKSAFDNLLIGFGDANADVEQLTQNVVEAFSNVLTNITPIIQNIVNALPTVATALLAGITGMLPMILETAVTIFTQVLNTIVTLLPQLIPMVVEALGMVLQAVNDNLPMILDIGAQIITTILDGIASGDIAGEAIELVTTFLDSITENFPLILESGINAVLNFLEGLIKPENLQKIIESGVKMLLSLINGIMGAIPQLIQAIPELISALVEAIIDNLDTIIVGAMQIVVALALGLVQAIPDLVLAIPEIISAIIETFANTDWAQIGEDIMEGIRNGLNSMVSSLIKSAKEIGGKILSGVKNVLGIHSPSKVFRDEVGKMIPEGLIEGIDRGMPVAIKDIKSQMNELVIGTSATLNAIPSVAPSNAVNNYGGFTINVNATDGQSANDIANEVMYRIQNAVSRREAVFA